MLFKKGKQLLCYLTNLSTSIITANFYNLFLLFPPIQVQLRYGWYRPDRPRSRSPCKFLRVTYSSKSLMSGAPCVTSSSHPLLHLLPGLLAHLDPGDQLAVSNHLPVLLVRLPHPWESYRYLLQCIRLLLRLPRTM